MVEFSLKYRKEIIFYELKKYGNSPQALAIEVRERVGLPADVALRRQPLRQAGASACSKPCAQLCVFLLVSVLEKASDLFRHLLPVSATRIRKNFAQFFGNQIICELSVAQNPLFIGDTQRLMCRSLYALSKVDLIIKLVFESADKARSQ